MLSITFMQRTIRHSLNDKTPRMSSDEENGMSAATNKVLDILKVTLELEKKHQERKRHYQQPEFYSTLVADPVASTSRPNRLVTSTPKRGGGPRGGRTVPIQIDSNISDGILQEVPWNCVQLSPPAKHRKVTCTPRSEQPRGQVSLLRRSQPAERRSQQPSGQVSLLRRSQPAERRSQQPSGQVSLLRRSQPAECRGDSLVADLDSTDPNCSISFEVNGQSFVAAELFVAPTPQGGMQNNMQQQQQAAQELQQEEKEAEDSNMSTSSKPPLSNSEWETTADHSLSTLFSLVEENGQGSIPRSDDSVAFLRGLLEENEDYGSDTSSNASFKRPKASPASYECFLFNKCRRTFRSRAGVRRHLEKKHNITEHLLLRAEVRYMRFKRTKDDIHWVDEECRNCRTEMGPEEFVNHPCPVEFKCRKCSFLGSTSGTLMRHIRIKHGENDGKFGFSKGLWETEARPECQF